MVSWKSILCIFLLIFNCYSISIAADYSNIHARPRLWRLPTDTWAGLKSKIDGNSTMLSRYNTFKSDCETVGVPETWTWGNVPHADFFYSLAQALLRHVESNTGYVVGAGRAIANNCQAWTIVTAYEADDPFWLMSNALILDWLYSDLTTEQKAQLVSNMETACNKIITGELTQDDFTQNEDFHNYHTGWISAVVIAGISLYGESASASTYLDWGLSRLCGQKSGTDADGSDENEALYYNFRKSMSETGGHCLFEGPGYLKDAIPEIAWGIEAWDTATNRVYNMWGSSSFFQQMENAGYSVIYMHTPAGNRFKAEDATYATTDYVTSYLMTLLSLLEARFENQYFKQYMEDSWSSVSDWGSWGGGQVGRRAFYFLFANPTISGLAISGLPKDRRLGDYYVVKTGWTTSDLYMLFKAGRHWKTHSHADHGMFEIIKGDNLLTGPGGWYDTSSWDMTSHRMAWRKSGAGSNVIGIYDSSEHQPDALSVDLPNSTGQRLLNWMRNPPFGSAGTVNTGGGAMFQGGGHIISDYIYGASNRYEEITKYANVEHADLNNTAYSYLKIDLSKAYTNAYSGFGSGSTQNINNKIVSVIRQAVVLKSGTRRQLVICDRVNANSVGYQISFITHQPYEPDVYDTAWQDPGLGIHNYPSATKSRWDYGTDRVFQKTLAPTTNYKYRVIGGPGYGQYLDATATNYPPSSGATDPTSQPWAIYVQPDSGKNTAFTFLTVIEIATTSDADITTAANISGIGFSGVHISDAGEEKAVIFVDSEYPAFALTNAGSLRLLIVGLSPAESIYASVNGVSATYTANSYGVLEITNANTGSQTYSFSGSAGSDARSCAHSSIGAVMSHSDNGAVLGN